jgi:penicillin G amidase
MTETSSSAPFKGRLPRGARRRGSARSLARFVAALVLVVLAAAALGVLWLYFVERTSLPQMDGTLHVAGLSAPVTVRRDAHGVPHIDAANQDDLFFAQGYVTAQDRLWQMDMFRRHADGNLAEILGPGLIEHDRMQRVLGIGKQAQHIYATLPVDDRRRMDDYARGVNAFIAQSEAEGRLPAEFRVLLYKPQPWTGTDSVSVGLMEVQELDMHAATKLNRWYVAAKLNNPKLESDLYPVGSWRDHPPTGVDLDLTQPQPLPPPSKGDEDDEDNTQALNGGAGGVLSQVSEARPGAPDHGANLRAAELALGRPVCEGCAVGSNEWVVAGKHTASGKPLLSNDMHIQLTEPNIWYMAGLRAPGFDAAGVTLPGIPYIIAGHNEHVAWGFTALMADVQDLYFEKLDGKGNYEGSDGQWHPLSVDREVIRVRGGRDVTVDVQSTDHGPLVNGLVHEPTPVALKWNLYDPSLHTIPVYAMNVAQNWAEFSAALADWCWPAQNLVYADDQGHIAYHAIGKVPLRPAGLMGLPIQDNSHEWQGYIPFAAMPSAFDPPAGFLATANSRVTTSESPYPLTLEWIDPYRVERIYKLLDGRDSLTPKDMLATQTDIYSELDQEMGQRFAYAIDHTDGVDDRLRKAADLLRSWDGKLTLDSAAASIVDQARNALWPLILKPKLGDRWKDYHWGESQYALEQIVMDAKPGWLPPAYKDWNALLTEAVRQGMQDGKAPTDVGNWKYGDWHMIDIENPLAQYLPVIGSVAGTGPQPVSGDTTTVKQISPFVGPSQRFTMDWSNVDGSTENIVLGESSDPLSPYYRDQWNAWYNGTTFTLPFTPAAVTSQTSHTLELEP